MMPIMALVHLADKIIEANGWREDLPRLLRPYAATADHIEVYEQREIIWDPKHVVAPLDAWQRSGGYL